MARKGRLDRGLVQKRDVQGKLLWYVRLYNQDKERQFGAFPNKTKPREFYEKAKLQQKEGKFFPERYQQGKSKIEEIIDRHVALSTVKNRSAEKHYGEWWKKRLKSLPPSGITPELLEEAQIALQAQNLTPQTVLHYMKFLRHLLNKCVRDGKLEMNPFHKVTLLKVPKGRTRFLTSEEETTLLDKLGPIYGPWARLAILTGLRLSEQFQLKWSSVDLEEGFITLPHSKAGGVQYVHLNVEAQSILRTIQVQQMNSRECGTWVFPSEKRSTHLDQPNLYSRIFVPAVQEAGLEGVTWHTLRHTFASRLAMAKHGEGTIAALLRHSTTTLVRRYAHLSQDHLKDAVEGLATFGRQVTPQNPNGTRTKTGTAEALDEVRKP